MVNGSGLALSSLFASIISISQLLGDNLFLCNRENKLNRRRWKPVENIVCYACAKLLKIYINKIGGDFFSSHILEDIELISRKDEVSKNDRCFSLERIS